MKVVVHGYDIFDDPKIGGNTANTPITYNQEMNITPYSGYDPTSGNYLDTVKISIGTTATATIRRIYYYYIDSTDKVSAQYAGTEGYPPVGETNNFTLDVTDPNGSDSKELQAFVYPINRNWLLNNNDPLNNTTGYVNENTDYNIFYNDQIRPKPLEIPLTLQLENCTSDYNKTTIQSVFGTLLSEELSEPDPDNKLGYYFKWQGAPTIINFVANEGYEFSSTYQVYDGSNLTEMNAKDLNNFSETFEAHYDSSYKIILAANKKVESLSSFTRIYRITKAKLNTISSERFTNSGTGDTLDYSNYIMNLYNLPLNINDEDVNPDSDIYLGSVKIDTKADQIKKDTLTYNLGKITVNEIYHGYLDYENTNCYLTVPFIETISLDPQNIINNTLNISLDVNLYNGSCVLYVKSENLDKIIYTEKNVISQNIPYYLTNNMVSVNSNVDQIIKNTLQAYIVVEREQNKQGLISDFTGYNTFSTIELKTNASLSEQNEILSQLQSGVYINE
mgnify:CR=1 FL=1